MELYLIGTRKNTFFNNFTQISIEEVSLTFESYSYMTDLDYLKRKYNIMLSKEEIIMFLSHREAWCRLAASSSNFCLIIEDNVSISTGINELCNSIEELPVDWDVSFPFNKSQGSIHKNEQPYLLNFYWGSCAYFLSKKGAKKLLEISSIRQPVDDEILYLALKDELHVYSGNSLGFNIAFHKSYVHDGRRKEISNTILSYQAWSESNRLLIRKILKTISALSHDNGIKLILHGGSLLGTVRHNQIIPWDDDVDLGIDDLDFKNFVEIVERDGRLKLTKRLELHTNTYFYKLWLEEGQEIENYNYKFPFVDIWLYSKKNDNLLFHNGIVFPNVGKYGFESTNFEESHFDIPKNYLECLDNMYTNWRHQIKIYPFCHRLEKSVNKPFQTNIVTDERGRFIEFKVY